MRMCAKKRAIEVRRSIAMLRVLAVCCSLVVLLYLVEAVTARTERLVSVSANEIATLILSQTSVS